MSMRIRIMKAIYHAPATAEEIAEIIGDDLKKVISNMGSICSGGWVKRIIGLDGTVEYKITENGKTYYHRNSINAIGESAALEIPEDLPPVPDVDSLEDAGPLSRAEESEEAIALVSIDPPEQDSSAPEPKELIHPDPEGPLYAIFGASLSNPELAGPTLSDAQQQAISLAYDCGADLQLYRLVPVGRTTTTVVFVES